jgi:MFS family permease
MLGWFAELNPKERRTMSACFGGWALDAFDVQMYSFVIPTVIALWGLSRGQAGLIGTVTLLISSLGGWFSGTLADRFGRVRMLQITILWYSVFTFLCAFAQNFEQLFILRALHGFGFGGEWAAGAVLMGEVIRDKYRGRGVGIVQTGWAIGWGASAVVYTGLYAFLPEAIAWRALFAIGLLPAIFVFWIRRHIDEPEIFRNTQQTRPTVGVAHLFSAFRGPYLWTTVKVSLMVAGAQGGGYLDADLASHGARFIGHGYRCVSVDPDPGCTARLSARDLLERRNRPAMDLSVVGDRVPDYGAGLHAGADGQRNAVLSGHPAEHHFVDEISPDGAFYDRALPDHDSRHRTGVLL